MDDEGSSIQAVKERYPVLDYPVADKHGTPLTGQVVVGRTLAGLFGIPLLVVGVFVGVCAIGLMIRGIGNYHLRDESIGTFIIIWIVLLALAVICIGVAVRWIRYAFHGNPKQAIVGVALPNQSAPRN